jgi:hypothetical protein
MFVQVKEEDALANMVVTFAKLLVAVEAEAKVAPLHLSLRKKFYLAPFDEDHG